MFFYRFRILNRSLQCLMFTLFWRTYLSVFLYIYITKLILFSFLSLWYSLFFFNHTSNSSWIRICSFHRIFQKKFTVFTVFLHPDRTKSCSQIHSKVSDWNNKVKEFKINRRRKKYRDSFQDTVRASLRWSPSGVGDFIIWGYLLFSSVRTLFSCCRKR